MGVFAYTHGHVVTDVTRLLAHAVSPAKQKRCHCLATHTSGTLLLGPNPKGKKETVGPPLFRVLSGGPSLRGGGGEPEKKTRDLKDVIPYAAFFFLLSRVSSSGAESRQLLGVGRDGAL